MLKRLWVLCSALWSAFFLWAIPRIGADSKGIIEMLAAAALPWIIGPCLLWGFRFVMLGNPRRRFFQRF